MKKHIFMATVAAMAMTACSSEDTHMGQARENSIDFASPFLRKSATRATGDVTTNEITNLTLKVNAVKYKSQWNEAGAEVVFAGQDLVYSATPNTGGFNWSYYNSDEERKRWDKECRYDFSAYAPGDNATLGTIKATYTDGLYSFAGIPMVQVVSNEETKSGTDLLLSKVTTTDVTLSGASGVELVMTHLMSKLKIYAYADAEESSTLKLKTLKMVMPSGDYNSAYTQVEHYDVKGSWSLEAPGFAVPATPFETMAQAEENQDYATYTTFNETNQEQYPDLPKLADPTAADAEPLSLGEGYFIAPTPTDGVMPIYVQVTYTDNGTERTNFALVSGLDSFKQGTLYNLYLKVSPRKPIVINTVAVEDWEVAIPDANIYVTN